MMERTTYRVPGLLHEYLSQPDHVGVIVKSLGEIDHLVSSILLVAVSAGSEKGREGVLGNCVALGSTAGFSL